MKYEYYKLKRVNGGYSRVNHERKTHDLYFAASGTWRKHDYKLFLLDFKAGDLLQLNEEDAFLELV